MLILTLICPVVSTYAYNDQSFASFCCGLHDLTYKPRHDGKPDTRCHARTISNLAFLLGYAIATNGIAQLDLQSISSLGFNGQRLQDLRQSVRITLALARIERQVSYHDSFCGQASVC